MVTRPSARPAGAGTGVDTAAERQLLPHVLTRNIELVGFGEGLGITVDGTGADHHRRPGRHVGVAESGVTHRHAEIALDRTFQPQRLLDEGGDQAAVVAQLLLQVRAFADDPQRGCDQFGGGFRPAANKNVAVRTTSTSSGTVPSR